MWIIFVLIVSCNTVLSVPCSLVGNCWERTDNLALLYMMISCVCHYSIWCSGSGVVFDCLDS